LYVLSPDGWKLIRNQKTGAVQLFDHGANRAESIDLSRERPGRVAKLRRALVDHVSRNQRNYHQLRRGVPQRKVPDSDLSEAQINELRALGYIRHDPSSE
jgi:hypothetical protein